MNRILQYDQIDFSPVKITQRDDPIFGPTTIFHDIVIAREIIHQYEDGWAYKPARELEDAMWTAEGRWVVIGRHPDTAVVSSRNDIGGRTVNVRYIKSLKDPKTDRPNNRGILADLEVFDSRVAPDILAAMKAGTKGDVSIGFFFDQDLVPGTIDEEGHPLNGTAYDYIQRNIMIDHTAAALDTGGGRCPMPYCGIGADAFRQLVTGDPFAGYETFEECIKDIMKENPTYTRKQAAGTCAVIEQRSKEKHKEGDEPQDDVERVGDKKLLAWEKVTCTNCGITWQTSQSINAKCWRCGQVVEIGPEYEWEPPEFETPEHREGTVLDYVGEEAQGQAASMTESKRAQMYFSIPEDEWAGLSEEEKEDYISRLPPKKKRAGGEEMSERDCVYEWEDVREKLLQKVPDKDRIKVEPAMLQRIITALVFDGDSVTVTAETMDKLREYGIDLEPCERDEEIEEEIEDDDYDEFIAPHIAEDALTYAQKKALPDSAYAYIEAGCKKEEGKTQQSCRHMPIHDEAHVRAALAALGGARTGKVPSYASKAKGKICAAAKKFKIKSEVCGTEKEKDAGRPHVIKDFERIMNDRELIVG